MHVTSAAVAKGYYSKPINRKPRRGTKIRKVYDKFYFKKGKVINYVNSDPNNRQIIIQLTDVYGLDIRCIKKGKWCLVGEWFGMTYIDYTQP